jgi:Tol biopolymer transport system component
MSIIGETLAHYRVTDRIGAGGMGEVYRATDSRLNRQVAIKVLPEAFSQDADRMARLHREAQVLASLSHPNIAAVYGLEEAGGRRALVMELVEGDDLSVRLRGGRLPQQEALRIVLGVAEALEAAHERGVVHRDLKPANIKVGLDGHVKVLDFGLAKALDAEASSAEHDPAHSPTLSLAATRAGLILGTAAYMSPEQASGAPVDKRSDVWSFGVVLFEILSGRRLFEGESVSHTLADVLRSDIDWSRLPADTPRAIRHLLERCLERDRRRRLRDIGEARIAIEEQLASTSSAAARRGPLPAATAPPRWKSLAPWGVAGAAVLAAAGLGAFALRTPAPRTAMHFDVKLTTEPLWTQLGPAVDVSADGSRLAYISGGGNRNLYVRPTDQLSGTRLVESRLEADRPYHPFFSPDGAWIGYVTPSELRKIPVTGGTPLTLAKVARSRGASWGPDGTIVIASEAESGLFRVADSGGELQPLTTLDRERGEVSHRWPQVLPDGRAVIFTSITKSSADYSDASIEAVVMATGERKVVHSGGTFGRYLPSGHLVYLNKGTMFAVAFDPVRLDTTGSPAPVLQDVTASPTEGGAQFAFSANGLLAYIRGGPLVPRYPIVWVERDGRVSQLLSEPGAYGNPRLSPDGSRLALTALRDGNWDIWVYDIAREVMTRLTFADSNETEQIWSPDARELLYSSGQGGADALYRKPSDGSGEERLVARADTPLWASDWSPDGRRVAFTTIGPRLRLGFASLAGEDGVELLPHSGFDESDIAFSPDGRWIAYTSAESGQSEIYVRSAALGGGRWQVSVAGGVYPRWARSGRELFYRTQDGIVAVAIEGGDSGLRSGRPQLLFKGAFRGGLGGITIQGHTLPDYDVTPDGRRFVMFPTGDVTTEERVGLVTIVSPWFDEVARIVRR